MEPGLDEVARQMRELHDGGDLSRRLSRYNTHDVGLGGENAFAEKFGMVVDTTLRPDGDGGRDFEIDGFIIDVKSTIYTRDTALLREAGKNYKADIFVLALVDMAKRTAQLLGWEFDRKVVTYAAGHESGQSILNHIVLATELRPMATLTNAAWLYEYEYGRLEKAASTGE